MSLRPIGLALGAVAIAAAAPVGVLGPDSASAETPQTREAAAYGLDWIGRVPDERFGAPANRPVVCLVDTGVTVTPDTPATSESGPIIARLSVFEEDPLGGDQQAMVHGTRMAAAIAAPRNAWGIVGVWPGARIVSVKASANGLFDSAATIRGITLCRQWSAQTGVKIAVVNLSLGSPGADPAYVTRWNEYVARVNADGGSVVAAAGNDASHGTQWPAAATNAIAVGAGTSNAASWCSFASRDALTRVVAPGCDVSAADESGGEAIWPEGGSSNAAAITSGVLASLRALRPDADRTTAEAWLTAGGPLLDSARVLDGRSIAAAAGLTDLLTPTPQRVPVLTANVDQTPELLSPAKVRARITRRALRVWVLKAAPGSRLQVAVRSGGRWRRGSGKSAVTLPSIRSLPTRVWVRWQRTDDSVSSPWSAMKQPSHKASVRVWQAGKPRGPRPPQR